jgi:hypothetical protein
MFCLFIPFVVIRYVFRRFVIMRSVVIRFVIELYFCVMERQESEHGYYFGIISDEIEFLKAQ